MNVTIRSSFKRSRAEVFFESLAHGICVAAITLMACGTGYILAGVIQLLYWDSQLRAVYPAPDPQLARLVHSLAAQQAAQRAKPEAGR